jgi:hypothetical protein
VSAAIDSSSSVGFAPVRTSIGSSLAQIQFFATLGQADRSLPTLLTSTLFHAYPQVHLAFLGQQIIKLTERFEKKISLELSALFQCMPIRPQRRRL